MLGAEKYLYVKIVDKDLVVRIPSAKEVEKTDDLDLYFDQENMYFFDKESEVNILYRQNEEREWKWKNQF